MVDGRDLAVPELLPLFTIVGQAEHTSPPPPILLFPNFTLPSLLCFVLQVVWLYGVVLPPELEAVRQATDQCVWP